MVQRHRKHVQSDEQHDYHIELFIRHYFKHYCLRPPLQKKTEYLYQNGRIEKVNKLLGFRD